MPYDLEVVMLFAVVVSVAGVALWRRDGLPFLICVLLALAPVPLLFFSLRGLVHFILLTPFLALASAMLAYTVMRIPPLRFTPWSACCAGVANALLGPATPGLFGIGGLLRFPFRMGVLGMIPAMLFGAVLIAFCAWLIRLMIQSQGIVLEGVPAHRRADPQERAVILKMMSEGKVTGEEAVELLNAAGGSQGIRSGSAVVSSGALPSLIGALPVSVGFVLPWIYVRMGNISGYQTGYQTGVLGWVILLLGVTPAILSCIPALDKHLRQPLLRLVLSVIGGGFAVAIAIKTGDNPLPVGIYIVIVGFLIQLIGGVAGIARIRTTASPS